MKWEYLRGIYRFIGRLIHVDFKDAVKQVDYSKVGAELDSTKEKYGNLLTLDEVVKHPGWLALVENDKSLLKAYVGSGANGIAATLNLLE